MASDARLTFATNGAEFDYPSYEGEPKVRYVIASTPRCGSNFLQRALWRSNSAGAPEEYLTRPYVEDFASRGIAPRRYPLNPSDADEFVRELWRYRTSSNGVFGIKMHGSQLHLGLQPSSGRLIPSLRDCKWIWMRRRNTIAQAVSYLLADQTGVWIVDGDWLPLAESKAVPQFSYEGVADRLKQIEDEELAWSRFLHADSADLHERSVVYYEDLVESYPAVLTQLFGFLGVTAPEDWPPAGIERQSTSLNQHWEEQFRALSGHS